MLYEIFSDLLSILSKKNIPFLNTAAKHLRSANPAKTGYGLNNAVSSLKNDIKTDIEETKKNVKKTREDSIYLLLSHNVARFISGGIITTFFTNIVFFITHQISRSNKEYLESLYMLEADPRSIQAEIAAAGNTDSNSKKWLINLGSFLNTIPRMTEHGLGSDFLLKSALAETMRFDYSSAQEFLESAKIKYLENYENKYFQIYLYQSMIAYQQENYKQAKQWLDAAKSEYQRVKTDKKDANRFGHVINIMDFKINFRLGTAKPSIEKLNKIPDELQNMDLSILFYIELVYACLEQYLENKLDPKYIEEAKKIMAEIEILKNKEAEHSINRHDNEYESNIIFKSFTSLKSSSVLDRSTNELERLIKHLESDEYKNNFAKAQAMSAYDAKLYKNYSHQFIKFFRYTANAEFANDINEKTAAFSFTNSAAKINFSPTPYGVFTHLSREVYNAIETKQDHLELTTLAANQADIKWTISRKFEQQAPPPEPEVLPEEIESIKTSVDWEIIDNNDTEGFRAYYNKNLYELVIVFKGTDSTADWISNLGVFYQNNLLDQRIKSAEIFLKNFFDKIKKENPPQIRLILSGHSLGALVAEYLLAKIKFDVLWFDDISKDLVVLHAECVTVDSPGSREIITRQFPALTEVDIAQLPAFSILSHPNIVSVAKTHIGKYVQVNIDSKLEPALSPEMKFLFESRIPYTDIYLFELSKVFLRNPTIHTILLRAYMSVIIPSLYLFKYPPASISISDYYKGYLLISSLYSPLFLVPILGFFYCKRYYTSLINNEVATHDVDMLANLLLTPFYPEKNKSAEKMPVPYKYSLLGMRQISGWPLGIEALCAFRATKQLEKNKDSADENTTARINYFESEIAQYRSVHYVPNEIYRHELPTEVWNNLIKFFKVEGVFSAKTMSSNKDMPIKFKILEDRIKIISDYPNDMFKSYLLKTYIDIKKDEPAPFPTPKYIQPTQTN